MLKASIRRSNGLEQSILCHGFSGAIEICLFFKKIYKTTDFDDCIKSLKEKLISDFREDMTCGVRSVATTKQRVKILYFKHFFKHFVFIEKSDFNIKKVLKNILT
ncbi:TPA: lanthionine synthetase LanC family protein [Streptococcus agalactiae]